MEKMYQVFVSSTYTDLIEARQKVIQALLELDCFPLGMELFPAIDGSTWKLITQVIDKCDYYILILAGRYGSLGPDGTSYTEMEYRYAIEQGKPVIAFLHDDISKLEPEDRENDDEMIKKLEAFRKFIGNERHYKSWATSAELGGFVSISLIKLFKTTPAIGWVRADTVAGADAAQEIQKRDERIEQLEEELAEVRTDAPKGTVDLAQGEVHIYVSYILDSGRGKLSEDQLILTVNKLFHNIAPLLVVERSEFHIRLKFEKYIAGLVEKKKIQMKAIAGSYNSSNSDHLLANILAHFLRLGYIKKSSIPHNDTDRNIYWTLTPYGHTALNRLLESESTDEYYESNSQ
ncbi:MAG: DUF4062 domain-containing protein [Candidatus Cloacimonetes bacterium]|nr:DUF4062 domain-containing protein [Candidatus Cloacimonadota bacterium]